MERKTVYEYGYPGFGFPVIFSSVDMIKMRGEWVLDIDYESCEEALVRAMADKPDRLTGAEIRFIRLHFGMTLDAFATRFGITKQAVIKWEKTAEQPTNMNWATEKDIRLFILEKKGAAASIFKAVYERLEAKRPMGKRPIILRKQSGSKGKRVSFQACFAS